MLKFAKNTKVKASYYNNNDNSFDAQLESGFSVMKVPVTEGVMAEQASPGARVQNKQNTFVTVTNYRTNSKGGFVLGTSCVMLPRRVHATHGLLHACSAQCPCAEQSKANAVSYVGGTFANGVYTAKEAGVFILSASQRIDGLTGDYVRMNIAINNGGFQGGLHSIAGMDAVSAWFHREARAPWPM